MAEQKTETLKITTDVVALEISSEPYVVFTYRGYAPVVDVRLEDGTTKRVFISSSSLAHGINLLQQRNGDKFSGIRMKVSKESDEKFAKYRVEGVYDD